jgi:hypothetical protein
VGASPAPPGPVSGRLRIGERIGLARLNRYAVAGLGAGLLGLVLVQVTLVSYLPTPWAVPDPVLVLVLALGLARGPLVGGFAGVWAGLLLDLVPPAAGPLAGWTLVLGCAGVLMGRSAAAVRPGPLGAMALVAVGAGLVVLAREATLWFAGDPARADSLGIAAASVAYGLLLAPVALVLVTRRTPPSTAPARSVPAEVVAP